MALPVPRSFKNTVRQGSLSNGPVSFFHLFCPDQSFP
ncbi:hypothetical protein BACCAP_01445 [Pseudoflavonifractor capillosus ATCC 29799]|uniref:Uncharacterized protein n=1 Tax=Pseudoflavonifractor capillosus ATCC 29799 TaxID=411467 RepID=A6NTB6_9FIRM|nr:hypothetical protein BACCAP_01445 [Pseudoflavonifractor capillosus ATCC 29799]